MQPGFPMGCSGHLLPNLEDLGLERRKDGAFFMLVAKRSTWGLSQILEIFLKICGQRDHSVNWI